MKLRLKNNNNEVKKINQSLLTKITVVDTFPPVQTLDLINSNFNFTQNYFLRTMNSNICWSYRICYDNPK